MPAGNRIFAFLKSTPARVLTVVLLVQLVGLFAVSRKERVPLARPLEEFPRQLGSWTAVQDGVVEKSIRDVLRADDILTRTYADQESRRPANLFVAFFRSQRAGQTPHSPKNCLPGSGWAPSKSDILTIPIEGRADPIEVNRYVVAKGEDKSVVLYWYQSRNRAIASEYRAKFYLVADAIRYNRTDTALVRVVVPVSREDVSGATNTAARFVQSFFMSLRGYLPSCGCRSRLRARAADLREDTSRSDVRTHPPAVRLCRPLNRNR
jgi:EpsI family protein